MKKIIVAVDFSNGSIHALDYASKMASFTGAEILIVWVDNHNEKDSLTQNNLSEIRKEAKDNLTSLIDEYSQKFQNVSYTFKQKKGRVAAEIANLSKSEEADLIIAGTHGGSGYEEYWIGSNANRIVMLAACPVITVSYGFDNTKGINKIVLPIDNTHDTILKVPNAIRFAKLCNAEIHLLGIYSTSLKSLHTRVDNYISKVQKLLTEENIKFNTEFLQSANPTISTISYIEEIQADLVIIMKEQEASNQNKLLGQFASQMVNQSPIPVLSIHSTK